MRSSTLALSLVLLGAPMLAGCSTFRSSEAREQERTRVIREARVAVSEFKESDTTIAAFFEKAHAYAIFPRVTKGAAGIGAAHGNGVVYQNGRLIGYADLTQVNVGFQLGGQSFSQVIFFEDERALRRFQRGTLEFSANASAVAVESGVAATNDYSDGVAVFSMIRGGLMYEASIGGQDFDYRPAN